MKSIRRKFKLVLGMALLTGLLISSMALAQAPVTEDWVARYDTEKVFWISKLTVDSYGNVYVVGSDQGGTEYVTIKYGPDGNQLWVASYVPTGNCVHPILFIVLDSQGNVYIASTTNCYPESGMDFVIIKYDSGGNERWVHTYDGPGVPPYSLDAPQALAVDSQGNVYVSGWTGYGAAATTIKYDPDGNELWVAQHWGAAGYAMALDSQGNAYVTGYDTSNGISYDYLTIKYNTDGQEVWSRRYNGPDSHEWAFAIAVDSNGNVYVAGNTVWTHPNPPVLMIVKYDNNGNELWASRYEGVGIWWSLPPHPLAVDSQGNVYITGLYTIKDGIPLDTPTMKYDSSGKLLWVAESGWTLALDSHGNAYVTTPYGKTIKYDSTGNKVWEIPYDGVILDIAVDAKENVYVVGLNSGNIVTVKYIQPYVQVQIDIKPGSYPNCFNQNERGVIPVAIFGCNALNVANIDIGSLSLQGLSVKVTGKSNKYLTHFEDINKDGYDDLIIQFQDSDGWVVPGSDYATLKGKLYNGTQIMGQDTICIIP